MCLDSSLSFKRTHFILKVLAELLNKWDAANNLRKMVGTQRLFSLPFFLIFKKKYFLKRKKNIFSAIFLDIYLKTITWTRSVPRLRRGLRRQKHLLCKHEMNPGKNQTWYPASGFPDLGLKTSGSLRLIEQPVLLRHKLLV